MVEEAGQVQATLHRGGKPGTKRPPLLLIHGAGGSSLHWPPQMRRMPGETVYALDLPGHGQAAGAGAESIEEYARIVCAWMEETELGRAVWIGHSMGGAIAMMAALSAPLRVAGLVLVGTGGRLRVSRSILDLVSKKETLGQAAHLIGSWAFGPQTPAQIVRLAVERMATVRPGVLRKDFLACNRLDVMGELSEIGAPTLIICGEHDLMTPPRYSQFLCQAIPGAELRVIPGAGHMVMIEKAKEVAKAVRQFMVRHFDRDETPC
jgi:pimeloyl-ACP methyl ester carboxylesterase